MRLIKKTVDIFKLNIIKQYIFKNKIKYYLEIKKTIISTFHSCV